jgi:hypothetical protein
MIVLDSQRASNIQEDSHQKSEKDVLRGHRIEQLYFTKISL